MLAAASPASTSMILADRTHALNPRANRDAATLHERPLAAGTLAHAPSPSDSEGRVPDEVAALLRENQLLADRTHTLTERVEDYEGIVKRLWRRGWAEAPSPRGLKELMTVHESGAAHDRYEANEAHWLAQRHLRESREAKNVAAIAIAQAQHATATLDMERVEMSAWHAADAAELSRRMLHVSQQLRAEQVKVAMLEAALEASRQAEGRALELGSLVTKHETLIRNADQQVLHQRDEIAELREREFAWLREIDELRAVTGRLQEQLAEEAEAHARQRSYRLEHEQTAATLERTVRHRVQEDLAISNKEIADLQAELQSVRAQYADLSRRAHEDRVQMGREQLQMKILIEKVHALHRVLRGIENKRELVPSTTTTIVSSAVPAGGHGFGGCGGLGGGEDRGASPTSPSLSPVDLVKMIEQAIAAAEANTAQVVWLDRIVAEREAIIDALRDDFTKSEMLRRETTSQMQETIDRLRWLQSNALAADGTPKRGRFRSMMYWESMKSCHANSPRWEREAMMSWRGDHDMTSFSNAIDLEHRMAKADGEAKDTSLIVARLVGEA